jgi:hypothetical protein
VSTLPGNPVDDALTQAAGGATGLGGLSRFGGPRGLVEGDGGLARDPTRAIVASDTRRPMTRWADGIARAMAGALGRRFGRHNFRGRSMRGGKR